jgi:flagellar biosynthesis protein FlhG
MRDQADRLRQAIDNIKLKQAAGREEQSDKPKTARVIAVTSGKGGVGKTNLTVNLAIALSELGFRVIIMDADFGLANIDVLFGIIPKYSLVNVIRNEKNILEILAEGPKNIKFISGGSGVEELVRLGKKQLERFVNNIALLDKIADIVLIDTAAGLSDNVMNFVMAADEVILITTPEPTSITDAYALIKMVANRNREKIVKVVVNRAENTNEGNEILSKLSLVAEKFLDIKLQSLGCILQDENVTRAVKLQQPFFLSYPKGLATKSVRDIAKKFDDRKDEKQGDGIVGVKGFINRLAHFLEYR